MNRELTTKEEALRHIGGEMVKRLEARWGRQPDSDQSRLLLYRARWLAEFIANGRGWVGEAGITGREKREQLLEAFRAASEVKPIRLRRVIIREWLFELLI